MIANNKANILKVKILIPVKGAAVSNNNQPACLFHTAMPAYFHTAMPNGHDMIQHVAVEGCFLVFTVN